MNIKLQIPETFPWI